MIEFCGEISHECKQYLLKKLNRINFFAALSIIIVLGPPIIIAGIVWQIWIVAFPSITTIILMSILLILSKTNPQTKGLNLGIPTKVTINVGTIEIESEKSYTKRELIDVKKVIDAGEWYHIIFYFPNKNIFFVCQKNLILKGSIEDFEKIFEDKIIRKSFKDNNH